MTDVLKPRTGPGRRSSLIASGNAHPSPGIPWKLVSQERFELSAKGLRVPCSTAELLAPLKWYRRASSTINRVVHISASSARVRTFPARRRADLLQRLAGRALVLGSRDLRRHEDPDERTVLDHGKATDLPIGHDLLGPLDVLIRADRDRIRGHDLGHAQRLRVFPRSDRPDDDVPIGDDPDEPATLHDGNGTAVLLLHQRGDLAQRRIRVDGGRITGHQLANFHDAPPDPGGCRRTRIGLGRRADLEDLGPAHRAYALGGGATILHRDLLRVFDLTCRFALHAIATGQQAPPYASAQRTLALSAGRATQESHKTPSLRTGFVVRKGRVGISLLAVGTDASHVPERPTNRLRAELLSVGTELLLGEIVDTNAAYLAGRLALLGIDCLHMQTVGDNLGRAREAFERALARSDLVVVTGGLGPTEDDLTREAIAAALGETPVVDPGLEKELRSWFAGRGLAMPERNRKQAWLIPSARALSNPTGTAPGWDVRKDGS